MSPNHAPWISALEADAPDVIACRRIFDWSAASITALQQELHDRVVTGSAPRLLAQQEAIGDAPRILAQQEAVAVALERVLRAMPERLLRAPGGEEDWNVAQTFAHTTAARRFLVTWGALDVDGRWPEHRPPTVTPSVPGRPDATREELLVLLDKSRRAVREAATKLEGHEVQTCRMDHPLIGNLRCGDWLMFIGVHDVMHLEQLDRLARQAADA